MPTAKSLLHFNGANGSTTFTDENGRVWTAYGNAQLSTTSPKFGSASLLLDGTGDYTTSPAHVDMRPAGAFTVSAWINTTNFADFQLIFEVMDYVGGFFYGFQMLVHASKYIRFWGGPNANTQVNGTTDVCDGAWHHVEMSYDGTTYRVFTDGNLEGSATAGACTWVVSALPSIGKQTFPGNPGAVTYYFNGKIDEVRFINGSALHTASFTPDTTELDINGNLIESRISNISTIQGISTIQF